MELNAQYPHLDAYHDVKPRIDAAIKEVGFLLGYQKTYFAIQRELKTALFRLTDEKFLERIKKENNEALLREVKKTAPLKDTIVGLIEDIDIFETENKKLLSAIIGSGKIDSKDFAVIYPYLYALAEDNTCHDRIPVELVLFFGRNTKEKCSSLSDDEYAIFCYLLIKIKAKGRYYFAYPHIADELVAIIESSESMPRKSRMNFYLEAAEYYAMVCQRDKAMTYYKNAAIIANDQGDFEASAYAMQKYYRLNRAFPETMQIKVDVDEIQKEYSKYAMIVLSGIQEPGFKIDPVEFTEGFAEKFQEVMWKVEEEIDKVGDLHTIYQRWSLREKYFAEMNITWRNPKTMNPDVMFD